MLDKTLSPNLKTQSPKIPTSLNRQERMGLRGSDEEAADRTQRVRLVGESGVSSFKHPIFNRVLQGSRKGL